MPLYDPNYYADPENAVASCHAAIEHGRQLVLDDLRDHSEHSAETYALAAASYVSATLMPNARKHLLAKMADNPTMAGSPVLTPAYFADHKGHLDELRDGLGWGRSVWACWMQDIAVGIAQVADELFQANGDGRGYPGSSVREFVFQFVHAMPEHNYIGVPTPMVPPVDKPGQVAKQVMVAEAGEDIVEVMAAIAHSAGPREPIAPHALADETTVTTTDLIERWLDAKGNLSRAERSRQGSSARLFVDAVGLAEATADRLAGIGTNAADRFAQHAINFPLAVRGERARISHIKSFIAFVRSMHIAVPDQDWTNVHD
jgi:hypothetical protein